MASVPRIPTATYRLQLNKDFTFFDAAAVLPYLRSLGISHVYNSPFYKSREQTTHGYDVTNHNEFDPALGGEEGFARFVEALQQNELGHLADFVPNHMGIADPGNDWWMDVLENGPSSIYAPFFDIDWHPTKRQLENKVLLPILGDQYGRVLERGEITIEYRDGAFYVAYYGWQFPVNPRSYPIILRVALEKLGRYADREMVEELESIITAVEHLPERSVTDEEKVRERAREKEVIKRRIVRLCNDYPQVMDAIEAATNQVRGRPGNSRSFDRLHEVLDAQPYRLSYWRVAAEEINYRRFFDVNELAAIKVENTQVFDTIHRLIFHLLREGTVHGIRIDHVDGLQDPRKYLEALRRGSLETNSDEDPLPEFYVVVEKILSEDEKIRPDWPIDGSTGYDFAHDATQILVESQNGDRFSRIYREFIDRYVHYESLIYEKRKLVMDVSFPSDIESLSLMLGAIAERDRLYRDFTLNSLASAVTEIIACFPVYRTYINADTGVSEQDRQIILRAMRVAKRRNASMETSVFEFIRSILLLENYDQLSDEVKQLFLNFVYKFQQVTSPIMAKGLEDTAFYIYNRLTALNEVGGSPDHFGLTLERWHERNRARAQELPHSLLTLTTHDTKRSEDVRARMVVLSEMPDRWHTWLQKWSELNADLKTPIDSELAPSPNEEYFFYQTLLGTWPFTDEEVNENYIQRMQGYMLKAIKEAKVNSSWIRPNEEWESAVSRFVVDSLKPEHSFRSAIAEAARSIAWNGMFNSLTQTILKLTCPGVPDFYQGSENWILTLVDPDNRAPIDYESRRQTLEAAKSVSIDKLLGSWTDGTIKTAVIHRLLRLRRAHPDFFASGSYSSIYASGQKAECVIAFLRQFEKQTLLVILPRLTTKLAQTGQAFDWEDTHLVIDDRLPHLADLFSNRKLEAKSETLALADLGSIPFAVFHNMKRS
ncbi:MAG: malto-oligosyltrehalose synthase [Verrucomicrobia bacterium]|nr:malto-oligosyltrehalose synthase [Verrucomicrobiota bacterium]